MNPFLERMNRRLHSLSALDPERDWIVLLLVATMLFLGILAWNVVLFDTVANGGVIGKPVPTASPAFSQSSLDAIHAVFANRAAEEAKYLGDTYHYADPSQ
jgi:Trk-type K+ transport system membrane component